MTPTNGRANGGQKAKTCIVILQGYENDQRLYTIQKDR